ncbi:hypothetical protein COS31_00520 [Candidatus Roizmanbacteria bacterium CG02_land_8_20_14_3_00_36_15]|uniref:Uncharacterized protein n=2 Tax=Candidatus Roizmaniibacteriota TaxID=1752723 RepID=A0A2M8KJS4_9BACT|nr:MAG: hypothetical protein COS51_01040 [Candidatus Roizmanbacteria bacterium CG03_land_8_20_14_0_80_36_21]PIV38230.1 MAG: hypothetical protein COS31_00520 [Candidatus Roizmanbacteria bacterium CG02_land_8_20_14_3_00_36_15]PIY70457.1 MAG: hypothetical protein COY89_01025 [Candidatus Roizmanbacteria bacterium CG_4_10_14_0_8_um_filter_36_36]PJA53702.1 MAG: hypothetical protein CO166_00975 [Candidatus Roizmanbacteria bacterium CG_4_9_14_3_um_filter_36_11]PJC81419.1 MAG: hypothetical protein CO007
MKKKERLCLISFFQAFGLTLYCSVVGLLFWKGNAIFGKVPNYWGPLLFLVIFTTSALISGLITLGYPFILFWEKKQTVKALKLIVYTVGWLIGLALILMLLLFAFK